MGIQLKNNAVGYLATAISASDTGAVLQTGNGASFPTLGSADYFYATLESTGGTMEIVKVTARSGDSLTIARAQDGSTANSFAAGSRFELRVTAQSVLDAVDQVDASQVSYNPPFTGSVATNVEAKLAQYVSVKDFGAVGDGIADDSSAIQDAINAAQGKVVFVPVGTYLLETPLELNWSTSAAEIYQKGTRLVGESTVGTVFLNRTGDYAMQHTVTSAQANDLAAGVRMSNGELGYFTIRHDGGSPAGSAGIKLFSFWFAHIHDVSVSGADGNALWMPKDTLLATNSDRYACGQLILERNDFRGSTGWGVKNDAYGNRLELLNNYVVSNEGGGLYLSGSGHNVYDNAVAGNGSAANIATCAGIHIAYNGEATPHISSIEKNEIQDNWGTHIWLEGYDHIIQQNRLLQDGTGGSFRNDYVVKVDATASGSALDNVIQNNVVRFSNPGAALIKAFYVVNAANTYNIKFVDNIFLAAGAGLTKYDFPSTRERIYAIEEGLQVASSGGQVQYTFPQISIVTPLNTAMTTGGTLLQFEEIYDPQTRWFGGIGDPNQKYVPLYAGVLKIDANLLVRQATTGTAFAIDIKKNSLTVATFLWPDGFPTTNDHSISFTHFLKVAAGDSIELFGVATTGTGTFSLSGTSTVSFQMI